PHRDHHERQDTDRNEDEVRQSPATPHGLKIKLDADLKAAFDRFDHHHLLIQLGGFPARDQIRAWLTAGVVEQGLLTPTEEGTPQGGVVSPLLLNIALHGMEHAAGVRYRTVGADGVATVRDSPPVLRGRRRSNAPPLPGRYARSAPLPPRPTLPMRAGLIMARAQIE
ncbi:reverse transcriptase domain-containing protein, partial [Micromonospora echinaurantiaca]|uniref:reverse transcriptase domain-containing protein n=1 Tax=Micromonospora echinaurantiaca TaxID=47857 RepID=UPI0037A5A398